MPPTGSPAARHLHVLASFLHEERGQDLIEYALLASFISLTAIAGASLLGLAVQNWYGDLASDVGGASGGPTGGGS
jgi:Flp pilus assembly pilin Flp